MGSTYPYWSCAPTVSILKIDDGHIVKVLSFVNECRSCRVPEMFVNYYKIRETGLNLRNRSSLDIPWARTDLGLSRCDTKGARLWLFHKRAHLMYMYICICIWELCLLSTCLPCEVLLPYSHLQTTTIWLAARWAPGFSGEHQQMQPCLCRLILYIVIHVCCNTLFVLCWE